MNENLNFARMKGPGDLPGNSRHPNSPDYVAPKYDYVEADAAIAQSLVERDEVDELVADVRNAAGLIEWIGNNVKLPWWADASHRALFNRTQEISRRADSLIKERNA